MQKTLKSDALEIARLGRADFGWYFTNILDVNPKHYWSKMAELCNSVRDNERTSVGAGHGVSKTYTLGRLALAFLCCNMPSTVVTTAPSFPQVEEQLWREIRAAHTNARVPLGGKLTACALDLQPETGLKWFAIGFSTRADTVTTEATRFQGYHNENLLIIFDEAAGILPEIWRAAEHIGAPFKRFIAVGNPVSAEGDFAEALDDPSYNHVNISVTDTPNYQTGKTIIPGVYGREYEQRIRLKYGESSDEYRVRVKGLKSQKGAEGAYYGAVMERLAQQGRITKVSYNAGLPVHTVWDPGYTTAVWFFQIIGMDVAFLQCIEDTLGMEQWPEVIRAQPYRYGQHFCPMDTESNNAYKAVAGKSLFDTAKENGLLFSTLSMERNVNDGIDRTRQFLYRCWFNAEGCRQGIKALKWYSAKKNERMSTESQPVFQDYPEKSWTNHIADAMRYASMAIKRVSPVREVREEYRRLKAVYV